MAKLLGVFQVSGDTTAANFVPLNTADDWLHLVLGIAMIGLGFLTVRRAPAAVR